MRNNYLFIKGYLAVVIVLILSISKSYTQALLSLEEAISIAVENNHQILIKRIDAEMSANNVNPALVGKRPMINLNASYELGFSDTRTEILPLGPSDAGAPINLDGISNDIIIAPELSLLLFDGKASTYRLEQLATISELSQLELRSTIEQTLLEVSLLYLDIARQKSLREIQLENIDLTGARIERIKTDERYGTASSLQELQVEIDLRNDSINLRKLDLAIANSKRQLNFLLGRDANQAFEVTTNFEYNGRMDLKNLETSLLQQSALIQLSQRNINVAENEYDIAKAGFKPVVNGYANLSFAYLQDDANFLQSNRTFGPNVGVRVRYPIADGGARKLKLNNAQLDIQKSKLEEERTKENLLTQLRNDFFEYQTALKELEIEQRNEPTFVKNLQQIEDSFRLGTATNLDVRTAQLNLNAIKNRINNYQYQIKTLELRLMYVAGTILQ
ncbi:MAG: TolC family protein [Bacteroidota bacterium]